MFEGAVGNNYHGDIALDDITLTPMPCGGYPSELSCMFEYGFRICSFEPSTEDDADWVWFDVLVGDDAPIDWSSMSNFSTVFFIMITF